jgi:signal transduction histidine kinase/CheY-like chemotaxis protein
MQGRWRLFRHEAARVSGPGPWTFLALYVVALAIGTLSTKSLGTVVFWPANAVMMAALLLLPRRQAIRVLLIGIGLNVVNNFIRGDQMPFFVINIVMNTTEALLAAVIARRVCGAALDLRRPERLWRFALLAVAPAVLLTVCVSIPIAVILRDYTLDQTLFHIQRFFVVEALGAMILTPALILLARTTEPRDRKPGRSLESLLLMGLLLGVTTAVFLQDRAPLAFLIFPPLLLVALRLSPARVAVSVIVVALIGGIATAAGRGPMPLANLPDIPALFGFGGITANMNLYYLFMLMVVITALPVSTFTAQRLRLNERLQARTLSARQAQRRAEHSDAARSRFLALMSHEMRTPLNSIAGFAEVLTMREGLDAQDREGLNQIRAAGEALLSLVEDVLEISEDDNSIDPEVLELEAIIAAAFAPHSRSLTEKGLSLVIEVRPDAAIPLLGDARRLRQTLQHLIGNAVKFTTTGGVTVRADRLDGHVLIAVTDSGCGFDMTEAASLFETFVQGDDSISRSHGGAGVGLAVARRQALLMGGDIVVDSQGGEGSTFTLRLPMAEATRAEAPKDRRDPGREGRQESEYSPHILVVDDHPANREVVRLMLATLGCRVDQAEDGDEAISMASEGIHDLILMDVRMPRVDGLTATRTIRALKGPASQVPILALTADAMPQDIERCLAAGMNGHIAKPISFVSLSAAIRRALSSERLTAVA